MLWIKEGHAVFTMYHDGTAILQRIFTGLGEAFIFLRGGVNRVLAPMSERQGPDQARAII